MHDPPVSGLAQALQRIQARERDGGVVRRVDQQLGVHHFLERLSAHREEPRRMHVGGDGLPRGREQEGRVARVAWRHPVEQRSVRDVAHSVHRDDALDYLHIRPGGQQPTQLRGGPHAVLKHQHDGARPRVLRHRLRGGHVVRPLRRHDDDVRLAQARRVCREDRGALPRREAHRPLGALVADARAVLDRGVAERQARGRVASDQRDGGAMGSECDSDGAADVTGTEHGVRRHSGGVRRGDGGAKGA
mmetsp:Transcript_16616/g.35109  ORF Transcript_16616/g.35109 Transcript_16616/m.35109 type:complete len:247 (-) Transcript_16616:44-784(-)